MSGPNRLDYETPTRTPGKNWAICSLVIGVAGAPASIAMAWASGNSIPMAAGGAAALVFMCVTEPRWKGHKIGIAGAVLTLLWAPPALLGFCGLGGAIL